MEGRLAVVTRTVDTPPPRLGRNIVAVVGGGGWLKGTSVVPGGRGVWWCGRSVISYAGSLRGTKHVGFILQTLISKQLSKQAYEAAGALTTETNFSFTREPLNRALEHSFPL